MPRPAPTAAAARFPRGGDYSAWRAGKLAAYPVDPSTLAVEVADAAALTPAERAALEGNLRRYNLTLYRWGTPTERPKEALMAQCRQLGFGRLDRNLCADEDGIASLRVVTEGRPTEYIPYSDRPIRWHTDGYYNAPEEQVRGFALHCVCDAAEGGANRLLDPEILYIYLRDRDPRFVDALMAPDAMAIPANVEDGLVLRPERVGPVFSVDPAGGCLHLRYTARSRSIRWKDDPLTREAVACLEEALAADLPQVIQHRLSPGEGVISNNVLHTREAFRDDPATGKVRLYLRARFHDRVAATEPCARDEAHFPQQ
jgi:hypothetical protein